MKAELGGGRGDIPYLDSYAFGLVRKDTLADTVCESADFKRQELYQPIGDLDKGVNLTVHADVLMSWARKKQFTNPSLIIYKVNLSVQVLAFYYTQQILNVPLLQSSCVVALGGTTPLIGSGGTALLLSWIGYTVTWYMEQCYSHENSVKRV